MACRIFVTALHSFGPLSLPPSASFIHHSSALASDVEGKPALFLISATFNFAPLFFSAFGSTFTFLHSLRLWVSKFLMSWKKNFIRIWLFSTNWFQGFLQTGFKQDQLCCLWDLFHLTTRRHLTVLQVPYSILSASSCHSGRLHISSGSWHIRMSQITSCLLNGTRCLIFCSWIKP